MFRVNKDLFPVVINMMAIMNSQGRNIHHYMCAVIETEPLVLKNVQMEFLIQLCKSVL